MPTYHYQCDACGASFDREQRISEDPIKKCEKCGRRKARRMIAGGNFILKGGGWYADGYGSGSSSGSASSSDSGSSGGSGSDD
ncbi:MAG: zinc ribbon domain-containing protein [Myxococcales bacterium]|nr:zinc ribbon domain-containing protein [Myxococcales bacterium]